MEKNNLSKTQQYLLDNAYAQWANNENKGFRGSQYYNEYYNGPEMSIEDANKAIEDLDFNNLTEVEYAQLNDNYDPSRANDGGGYHQPYIKLSDGRYTIESYDYNQGDFGPGTQEIAISTEGHEVASLRYLGLNDDEIEILYAIEDIRSVLKKHLKKNKEK